MEHYVYANGKKLRCGYTTGSTATLAVKASAITLLTSEKIFQTEILTPKGIKLSVNAEKIEIFENSVKSSFIKDAGDDIDATDKAIICAEVWLIDEPEILISGGVGVGKITQKGLEQPIGEYAINSVPRKMIFENLRDVAEKYKYNGGFKIEISVPNGEKIAQKTFNGKLGIVGGISILGTSGIVEPSSVKALIDSIEVELKQLSAQNVKDIVISSGNYSENMIKDDDLLSNIPNIKCTNFIGDTLDLASIYEFENILLIGHIGKFVKLAGGIMNTHSRQADCRVHIFSAYSALCGANQSVILEIMNSKTTDACIEILKKNNLCEQVMEKIIDSAQEYVNYRTNSNIGIIMFSNVYGVLGISKDAKEIMEKWRRK